MTKQEQQELLKKSQQLIKKLPEKDKLIALGVMEGMLLNRQLKTG